MKKSETKIEQVSIKDLRPYEKNAKHHTKGQIKAVAASIKEFGFNQPVVIDRERNVVVGHGRIEAAKLLKMETVPCIRLEGLSPEQVKAYRLADNKLNESPWDMNLVMDELRELSAKGVDILLTGFSPDLLLKPDPKDDDVPENPIKRAKLGDLWALGEHRLIVGDSTDDTVIERLMGGGTRATMCFTDPPYNVNYTGSGGKKRAGIKNDKLPQEQFEEFLSKACAIIMKHVEGGIYICMGSSQIGPLKIAFEKNGGHWQDFITWVKNQFTLSGADYQHSSEQILYGWPAKSKKHYFIAERNGANVWEDLREVSTEFDGTATTISFQGFKVRIPGKVEQGEVIRKRQRTDIWRYDKPLRSDSHPTMKPVALVTEAIVNSSKSKDIVLDLFMGSGSTLIACEKAGRICYGSELDSKYADVILKRWEDYSGKKAKKL